jgi:hypothetical protein
LSNTKSTGLPTERPVRFSLIQQRVTDSAVSNRQAIPSPDLQFSVKWGLDCLK